MADIEQQYDGPNPAWPLSRPERLSSARRPLTGYERSHLLTQYGSDVLFAIEAVRNAKSEAALLAAQRALSRALYKNCAWLFEPPRPKGVTRRSTPSEGNITRCS